MIKILSAAAAAFVLVAPASAFDNSTCKTFLAGKWTMQTDRQVSGKKAHYEGHSTYSADGTFDRKMTITVEGMPSPQNVEQTGTWDAKAGPSADTCEATVAPKDGKSETVVLMVVDEKTVKGPDGTPAMRE